MKKIIPLIAIILSFFLSISHAQEFCGTPAYISPELIEFQTMDKSEIDLRSNDPLYIRTVIHVVGNDNGRGYVTPETLFDHACKINEIYGEFGIEFYISSIKYINNSNYYNHNYNQGSQMFRNHKVSGALNLFFVGDPAGACGYYSPADDCIAIKNGCLGKSATTWPHEVGHYFSLPHTFLGWEGRDYDPNEDTPAVVGRRQTEKLDGSNCARAGDGFCDTPPDYLSYRWPCDEDFMSHVKLTDVNGEKFHADGKNIMSYSNDGCANMFSDQQIAAMKYNILTTRRANVSEPPYAELEDWELNNVSPKMNENVYFDNVSFSWDPIEGAIGYILEYTSLPEFNIYSTKVFVLDPFYRPDTIYPSWTNIQWRVKPYGHRPKCAENFSEIFKFGTEITAVYHPEAKNEQTVFPNPISTNKTLNIRSKDGFAGDVYLRVYDITGNLIIEEKGPSPGMENMELDIRTLHPGIHFIQIITDEGKTSHKIMVLE